MQRKNPLTYLGIVVMLGAVWGLSEAVLGMHLKRCAAHISGSLMTGIALFFIAASWIVSRRILGVVLLVAVASLMKLFDALLLDLPILHGAIANPIFAFVTEGIAFILIMTMLRDRLTQRPAGQALSGGLAALLAVNLFPLVKFATGIPACVVPGTGYPLSLYYVPYAVCVSLLTLPAGFWLGIKLQKLALVSLDPVSLKRINCLVSPATLVLCLSIMALLRLV